MVFSADRGPAVVGVAADGGLLRWNPGAGRFEFAAVEYTGSDESSHQMRSNASGIGVIATARIGGDWADASSLATTSGPGQSLQPRARWCRRQ
ncbi:MAG: hypothetical protein R3C10_04985 [Pirellulales bacterium]